jgi:hypothetical protein
MSAVRHPWIRHTVEHFAHVVHKFYNIYEHKPVVQTLKTGYSEVVKQIMGAK